MIKGRMKRRHKKCVGGGGADLRFPALNYLTPIFFFPVGGLSYLSIYTSLVFAITVLTEYIITEDIRDVEPGRIFNLHESSAARIGRDVLFHAQF